MKLERGGGDFAPASGASALAASPRFSHAFVARRVALLSVLMTSCRGRQSALDPAGRYAQEIANLWWIFFAVCAVIYLLVIAFLFIGAFRSRERAAPSERSLGVAVGSAIGATVLILFTFLFLSTSTGNALTRMTSKPHVTITVTAQQWWWDVEYYDPVPSRRFTTANEIYVPVGRPVNVILESRDVIHSLWIPNIHGKRDLMPGHKSSFVIQADRPGTYEGQCAEFCGHQHAKMRLLLTAVSDDEFRLWSAQQRQPAPAPRTPIEQRGQQVFLSASCPMCHAVNGTPAQGRRAPDLTHIASRKMIAANSIPNTRGHLAGWILDPQTIKPGVYMPPNPIPSADLQALLAYLGTLK